MKSYIPLMLAVLTACANSRAFAHKTGARNFVVYGLRSPYGALRSDQWTTEWGTDPSESHSWKKTYHNPTFVAVRSPPGGQDLAGFLLEKGVASLVQIVDSVLHEVLRSGNEKAGLQIPSANKYLDQPGFQTPPTNKIVFPRGYSVERLESQNGEQPWLTIVDHDDLKASGQYVSPITRFYVKEDGITDDYSAIHPAFVKWPKNYPVYATEHPQWSRPFPASRSAHPSTWTTGKYSPAIFGSAPEAPYSWNTKHATYSGWDKTSSTFIGARSAPSNKIWKYTSTPRTYYVKPSSSYGDK